MKYNLYINKKAKNEFYKLSTTIQKHIKNRLNKLLKNPKILGKPLKHSIYWSCRSGDYRIIYEILDSKKEIIVLYIGHRKKCYIDFDKFLK